MTSPSVTAGRLAAVRTGLPAGSLELASHAAVPVAVDAPFLNLLRVNFFSDPPLALPFEVEADLLASPLFRDIGDGLFEIDSELRNLLLMSLVGRFGPHRLTQVATLLEQYTDRTAAWRAQPELDHAQRLTALSLIDPAAARAWLEAARSSVAGTATLGREWFVAMGQRLDGQPDAAANIDAEIEAVWAAFQTAISGGELVYLLRRLGYLALLPGADHSLVRRLLTTIGPGSPSVTGTVARELLADLDRLLPPESPRPAWSTVRSLVDALRTIPAMGDRATRDELVEVIGAELYRLRSPDRFVPYRSDSPDMDLIGIVNAVLDHLDGLSLLARAVVLLAPDEPGARAVVDLCRQLDPTPATTDPVQLSPYLPDLLGIGDPALLNTDVGWAPGPSWDLLRVPFGVDPSGNPVVLDLKEAAEDGMGPHGIVVGAVGSGKTELLRTLVVALAATHSPVDLNFLLVDYVGTTTFAGLDELPHTSAVIDGLEAEPGLVGRLGDALVGELRRRTEILGLSGFGSRSEYEATRRSTANLAPMPALLVVCDEFNELLAERPGFIHVLTRVGRTGRALGVQLLLASHRVEEGRLSTLATNLSYRIALRTNTAAESRAVIGVQDAGELPRVPGVGYLKSPGSALVRFRAANSSELASDAPVEGGTVAQVLVSRMSGRGRPARRVWLPPLPRSLTLGELLPPLIEHPERGLTPSDPSLWGKLRARIGLVDRPDEQRQDNLVIDLRLADASLLVVGGPGSGKSAFLTAVIYSLALTHTPEELRFYCVSGSAGLEGVDVLPHTGAVAGAGDGELIRRVVAEFGLALRGSKRYGTVVLVVHDWGAVLRRHPDLQAELVDMAATGHAYGVHVIASATDWGEVSPAAREAFRTRFELRLRDPAESLIDLGAAADVPAGPGRGILAGGHHFLAAAPRLEGGTPAPDGPEPPWLGIETLIRAAWHGPTAPPIRTSPPSPAPSAGPPEGEDRVLFLDVGILTVLSVEMRAVVDVLERQAGYRSRLLPDGSRGHEARFGPGEEIRVAAIQSLAPGPYGASEGYRRLRQWYAPRVLLLLGIAGAIHPDVAIGDVVIGTQVIYYDALRETEVAPVRRGEIMPVTAELQNRLNDFMRGGQDVAVGPGRTVRVHCGPVGSGGAVAAYDGQALRQYLTSFNDKTLAVDTEAAGFAQAYLEEDGNRAGPVRGWLTVRGISDLADSVKHDGAHELAARNAAAVMERLLPYLVSPR